MHDQHHQGIIITYRNGYFSRKKITGNVRQVSRVPAAVDCGSYCECGLASLCLSFPPSDPLFPAFIQVTELTLAMAWPQTIAL